MKNVQIWNTVTKYFCSTPGIRNYLKASIQARHFQGCYGRI